MACLLAFHTLVRSANLFADQAGRMTHLTIGSITKTPDGFLLDFPALKNERFLKKTIKIPVRQLSSNHPLCVVTALQRSMSGRTTKDSPLLAYKKNGKERPLSSATFVRTLRTVLQHAGFDATRFSVHSFRRGAATFSSQTGISVDALKAQGNWRSDCYQRYISREDELRNLFSHSLSLNL